VGFALRLRNIGQLRRTARFIALTTYGGREEALGAIERVRHIQGQVRGVLPNGVRYSVIDPDLLTWVHLLPRWARRRHGLSSSGLARPLVTGGTAALAGTLRWVFAKPKGR